MRPEDKQIGLRGSSGGWIANGLNLPLGREIIHSSLTGVSGAPPRRPDRVRLALREPSSAKTWHRTRYRHPRNPEIKPAGAVAPGDVLLPIGVSQINREAKT